MLPALNSMKKSRVRVFSEDDARIATLTSAVDRSDLINNHAESHVSGSERDSGMVRSLGHDFEDGDLVWGKVKSYPWWPGFIYNEAFASSSARLLKKEGFVLVAFFGDSSYGWFDPTQLIPFDVNFDEKSKQLSSKAFSNAVEDAVDEASRRSALGLMCRCRYPDNFASTSVEGYFSVQVPDYDSGVYSEAQIRKAKNDFRPSETLRFIKLLSVAPHGGDDRSCNFAKSKAVVFAFRRAVFGLHDETHAEAVGAEPVRHSNHQASSLVQPVVQNRKEKTGFGPPEILAFMKQLAIACHCIDRKSCNFVKNKAAALALRQSMFKMHKETNVEAVGAQPLCPSNPKANPIVQQLNHPASDYDPGIYSKAQTRKETVAFIKQLAVAPYGGDHQSCSFSKNKAAVFALRQAVFKLHDGTGVKAFEKQLLLPSISQANRLVQPLRYSASGVSSNHPVAETETLGAENTSKSVKAKDNVMKHKYLFKHQNEASDSYQLAFVKEEMPDAGSADSTIKSKVASKDQVQVQPNDNGFVSEEITLDSKHNLHEKGKDSSKEKTKRTEPIAVANKRLVVMALPSLIDETSRFIHLDSKTRLDVKHGGNAILSRPRDELLITIDELKNRKVSVDGVPKKINVQKRSADDLNSETSAVIKKRKSSNLQPTLDHVKKPSTSEKSTHPSNKVDLSASKQPRMCRELLHELKTIALDHFHGINGRTPSFVIKFVLRYRSHVYQKSLVLSSPSTKNAVDEVHATNDHASASPIVKPVGQIIQADDSSKVARKRALTNPEEEIDAKRLKKIKELKAPDAEKKPATLAPPEIDKPNSTGEVKQLTKLFEPTELAIYFPPMAPLPSIAELKARFGRFGRIHKSSLRVFSNLSACRVVFMHKDNAEAAYKFSVANQSLFGIAGVRYFLRELELSSHNISEVAKASEDIDHAIETKHIKDPAQQPLSEPINQLKSILKKSTGNKLGRGTGKLSNSKETQRVKFTLAGEETTKGEQLVDGSHPSVAMDFNTKNVQKVNSQLSSALPIQKVNFQPSLAENTPHYLHNSDVASGNTTDFINTDVSATTTIVDISKKMMYLLTRCHDLVTNLKDLGQVPYRPL
ncbi:PWWP domain-containing protein 1-like [Vicia villosa]|uniref:PWWP domain-containing protein 1-like n=1 Tax=Vicia villosa TaxID=3911 RepID=UPI00273CA801|nr:PWWP domain-containing protein 1-like [Vicia villosa]